MRYKKTHTESAQILIENKIDPVLAKIDEESETPELISNIIYKDFEDKAVEKQLLFSLLRHAIRYACLLDKYHETEERIYLEEAQRQRLTIFDSIPDENHYLLESVEKRLLSFWEYEKQVQIRIEEDYIFSDAEIKEYIFLRASDSLFYCTIASFFYSFTPEMTELFHQRLMLFDILDSIKDYEEDLKDSQPNILIMYLLNYTSIGDMPTSLQQALNLSCQFKIVLKINKFGGELYQQALKSECLNTMPLLKKDFDTKYFMLVELLQ